MNLFYRLWLEAINREEKKRGKNNGKIYAFLFITFCQALNLMTILITLKTLFFIDFNAFLNIDIFPRKMLDGMLSGFLSIIAPFMVLNYLIIFKGKRYMKKQERYQPKGSKLYFTYVITSFFLFFVPIIIGFLLSRI
ncbi:MAG: hypothetical protein KBE91_08505 [Bacteroidia bacterium]|nr:hypothetical protein [Bacteroidia bacterium]